MAKIFLSVATSFVAIAEVLTSTCVIWILGQEEMPEDLID